MTVSHWIRHGESRRVEADIAIVGGGVCGVAAALELEARGHRATIIERGAIGSGASTRNAGYLMRGAADNYAAACRDHGRSVARTLWRWTEENLGALRAWGIDRLGSYRPMSSCLLALQANERAELEESVALLGEDGFDAELITGGDDAAWSSGLPLAGLVNPHDAVCSPAELMAMLRARLAQDPIEGAEAFAIEPSGDGILVRAPGVDVRAERVLICLNGFASALVPELAGVVTPQRGQMLAVHAPSARLDHAYYANHGSEYIRPAGGGVVAVGGCRTSVGDDEQTAEDAITPPVQAAIEDFASRLLGARFRVIARWSGTMGFSPDGMPLIGPLPGRDRRVWFCGGFTGHGMSLGVRAARAAVEALLHGEATPFPLARALGPTG